VHISRIELENIKSYASAAFDFARGTTAITGENGAGKTTIIESIAWVLFDLLEYKKDDFVRRGEKKGSARLTLVSGLDEREYIVFRDTAAGYNITDPQLGVRIADKKEEVTRFLWQHLGLEPGTDLRSLFRQAIGVPQGTFTAIFLEGYAERKAAFDRLLKVEEYRQAAEKLLETSRYLDASISGIRETIARSEGELGRTEVVGEEHARVTSEIEALTRESEAVSRDVAKSRTDEASFASAAAKYHEAKTVADRTLADHESARLRLDQSERDMKQAERAAELIATVAAAAERHTDANNRLKSLDADRSRRDALLANKTEIEKRLITASAEAVRLNERLEGSLAAEAEIEKLAPKVAEQEHLEARLTAVRERLEQARLAASRLSDRNARIERVRIEYKENQDKLRSAQQLSTLALSISLIEKDEVAIVTKLADLRAELDTDERFRREIENGFCPVLTERCLNIKPGQTLENFVADRSRELGISIEAAEKERGELQARLKAAREAQLGAASLSDYRARSMQLLEDGNTLKAEIETLANEASVVDVSERETAALEPAINALGDPRARMRFLISERENIDSLRRDLSALQHSQKLLEAEGLALDEALAVFTELDSSLQEATAARDSTAEAYRTFIANEGLAKSREARKQYFERSRAAVDRISDLVETANKNLEAAAQAYDVERHDRLRADLLILERREAQMLAQLEAAQTRARQIAEELARFTEIRRQLADDFREKERLEAVAETTAFIRVTLKEAAPRVAKNYVHRVSLEANQLFRDITGDADRTLRWTDDYSVTVEEGGFERPFISLSGGEQMSAALAVRLALLKQLSDIRIAFFDEPTTNMDNERRENFAAQIGRVKNFDQLFVISHDDTFDNYVDHHVRLERDGRI